jgi:hypothetical protein
VTVSFIKMTPCQLVYLPDQRVGAATLRRCPTKQEQTELELSYQYVKYLDNEIVVINMARLHQNEKIEIPAKKNQGQTSSWLQNGLRKPKSYHRFFILLISMNESIFQACLFTTAANMAPQRLPIWLSPIKKSVLLKLVNAKLKTLQ